ncbi:uncharacterized protein PGTG_01274 [Puccinia graminis f. sp. tritici CRL 75-36-700-3]|uniref:Uncharacterized protein n=1 Tax=Puccinia graminis f. sp. tritici (strain CRL 75-36-700-3 / race SCCL) TaxID=418459 RepID=E3JV68_PUCGT|nr:uncharacterized protein PGTG_01274 [Puccinia graminis f. sp. tritici CRL 75-36-700-3]EFP75943.1 hypothetical protein PGTG_01274 [Puccinia graminis f. sp. tritici CRL 75-36-700-3]
MVQFLADNPAELKHLQRQGNLVVERFEALDEEYSAEGEPFPYHRSIEETFSADQLNFKRGLLNQLHSHLLPALGRQIGSLSRLLDPSRLRSEPGLTLNLILSIQSELNHTLKQIQSALYIVCPYSAASTSTRTNDQHRREFKSFRIDGMFDLIAKYSTMTAMSLIFSEANALLKQLDLSTKPYEVYELEMTDIPSIVSSIADNTADSWKAIELTIEWLQGSELNLVQLRWPEEIRAINETLQTLLSLTDSTSTSNEHDELSGITLLSKPAIQLAKSLTPIVKLSRLFFNKLSKRGMNRKRLPLFTEMRSDQLKSLAGLAREVSYNLGKISESVRKTSTVRDNTTSVQCTRLAEKIETRFESSVLLISFYFVPLIADTDVQNYYKTWLATWFLQLNLAMQKLRADIEWFGNTI